MKGTRLSFPISRTSAACFSSSFYESTLPRVQLPFANAQLRPWPIRTFSADKPERIQLPRKKRRLDEVADKIRRDKRVSIIERTNLRYLSELPQQVDLVTLDLSFISILLVMPAIVNLMKAESTLVTLVKPQFEARKSQVGGGGIVRDPQVHQEVLEKIITGVQEFGFCSKGWIESPIKGAEGNIEFLACFQRIPKKAT